MRVPRLFNIANVVGVLIATFGLLNGMWWLTFVAGLLIGAMSAGTRLAIPAGGLIGLLAWGVTLALDQSRVGLGPAAESLAAIMGFTHQPAVPVILTCLVGLLLGLTGAWLASALRGLLVPATR